MESPSEAATFSQVVFTHIPHSYPPSTPVTCHYTLTSTFQPHPRDWVGIFKVGWSTAKDYHTFVWVEPCQDVAGQQPLSRQAVFKDYYLPKDEIEFYQFCYIDSGGQVRGASTPFCFKHAEEQSAEGGTDDDLLVITTQEQVEQSVREKAELQKKLDEMNEENQSLKNDLERKQEEAAALKGQNEEKEKEKSELLREMDLIKEQNGNLKSTLQQQSQDMDHLKEELVQMTRQAEIQQDAQTQSCSSDAASSHNESRLQEKYDRAVLKINQLKEEGKELREKLHVQGEEIVKLNCKLREGERELLKARDSVQLLQVDLQSSEKEKERLSAELLRLQSVAQEADEVTRENRELCRRLSEQERPRDVPQDDLRAQCESLSRKLQLAEARLAGEAEEGRNARRKAEFREGELLQVKEQLDNVSAVLEQEQRSSGKMELQLREALETIAARDDALKEKEDLLKLVTHEKDELSRENQNLKSDIDGLRRLHLDLDLHPAADLKPDAASAAANDWQEQETADQTENLYETIGSNTEQEEEAALVCRHCQESFPGITRLELEEHERSHRVCPFCTMICDDMEQSVFEDHVYSHEM